MAPHGPAGFYNGRSTDAPDPGAGPTATPLSPRPASTRNDPSVTGIDSPSDLDGCRCRMSRCRKVVGICVTGVPDPPALQRGTSLGVLGPRHPAADVGRLRPRPQR